MGLLQKLNGKRPFAVVSDAASPPDGQEPGPPDGREDLRLADAACKDARQRVAELEARLARMNAIVRDADAAQAALQAAVDDDGGEALEAYAAGQASDQPIARLVEHKDTTSKAASAAKDALPGVQDALAKARAELVRLEELKFSEVILFLKRRAKDEHEAYVNTFNALNRSYEKLCGIAVALAATGHAEMMTTALPVAIQAPGFNMGLGPSHGPSERVIMGHLAGEAEVAAFTAAWMQARERLIRDVDANVDGLIGMQFQYESDRGL